MKRIRRIVPNIVSEISYRCDLYKDTEEGTVVAYWTGEIDTWGKLTLRVVEVLAGGDYFDELPATMYLFPREILTIAKAECR